MQLLVVLLTSSSEEKPSPLKIRMNTIFCLMKKSQLWNDFEKQELLEKLLTQLEVLLLEE